MDITFNTGRKYTARGQVIRAVTVAGGAIFADFSRGIVGRVCFDHLPIVPALDAPAASCSERALQQAVLSEYDAGRYSYDFDAAQLRELEPAAQSKE